jgi:hypothetical protein
MNKLYQYTILSKDIINLIGKYLLPSRIKQDLHNELLLLTIWIRTYIDEGYKTNYNHKYRHDQFAWFIL